MPFTGNNDQLQPKATNVSCLEFADREDESVAMRSALSFMAEVLRGGRSIDSFHHVLMFYGASGTGKTTLSHRLQQWLDGELPLDDHWGFPPGVPNVVTVRWDLNGSTGDVDTVQLLLQFRDALPGKDWRALDLALLSYFQAVRPGQSIELSAADAAQASVVGELFKALTEDVANLLDFGTGTASWMIRKAIETVSNQMDAAQRRRFPGLESIVERCNGSVTPSNPSPDVAAAVLQLADQSFMSRPDSGTRPLVVVFIDHFERLTGDGRRLGEAAINRLVASLPNSLFVVTGRNRLDWDSPSRTELRFAGPRFWPALMEGYEGDGPRQHSLRMLSERDAEEVFRRRERRGGFTLSDADRVALVQHTQGWPVHIDAICTLASSIVVEGSSPSFDNLAGPLDDVVRRLLENLTEKQARAFHGACLLPYFNVAMVAEVAEVAQGDVEGMIRRATVEPNEDSEWPYRVHDAIRRIVRDAPAHMVGGWTDTDWENAAHRGLGYLRSSLSEAFKAEQGERALQLGALVVVVAAEHGVWEGWLGDELLLHTPTAALGPRVPRTSSHPETQALLDYLWARSTPTGEDALQTLIHLGESAREVAKSAALWAGYRHRRLGSYDSAIVQFVGLRERHPDWDVPTRQIGNTLAEGRRFRDAIRYASEVPEESGGYVRSRVALLTGELEPRWKSWEERLAECTSLTLRTELLSAEQLWLARLGRGNAEDAADRFVTAVNRGHETGQRVALHALLLLHLDADGEFERYAAGLRRLGTNAAPSLAAGLALRAMLRQNKELAVEARALGNSQPFRSAFWIPAECYLDALNMPLDPVPTQWVEPYEEVKSRWLRIADRILDQAKGRRAGD